MFERIKYSIALAIIPLAILSILTLSTIEFESNLISNQPNEAATMLLTNHRSGTGSAVHIGNGFILTAHHNLQGTPEVELTTVNGVSIEAVHLWSSETTDISLYYTEEFENLQSYLLICDPLNTGDELTFIGNPMNLTNIEMQGRVAGDIAFDLAPHWTILVPVQAPIVPGMSGGPAIDHNNRLRGINVAAMIDSRSFSFSYTGMAYIVPGETLCRLLSRT